MTISYPRIGNTWVAFKTLLENIGYEFLLPPPITEKTVALGVKYSPETACFPLKVVLGFMVEALDQGTESIFLTTLNDADGFTDSRHIHKAILNKLGYSFQLIVFNPGTLVNDRFGQHAIDQIKNICDLSKAQITKTLDLFLGKLEILKINECRRNFNFAHELVSGSTDRVFKSFIREVETAESTQRLRCINDLYERKFDLIKKDKNRGIKVAIIGELCDYMVRYVNFDLERTLGEMGVEVYNFSTYYEWLKCRQKQRYLKWRINNDIKKNIERGLDGIIHLCPFNCRVEAALKPIMLRMCKTNKMPILSLKLDEQTSEIGFNSRVEAFVDLIKNKS